MAAARKASSSAPSAVPRRRSGDSSFSVAIRSSRVGGDGGALGKKRENSFMEAPYEPKRRVEPRDKYLINIRKMPSSPRDYLLTPQTSARSRISGARSQ